jgi:hypothetical protein
VTALAVALGLALLGLVCVVVLIIPRPNAHPSVNYLLGAFALVFFLIGAGFAFGLIKA